MIIFSKKNCVLGEGPLWSNYYEQFFWLDITQQKIYAKSIFSKEIYFDNCWSVNFIPTALIHHGKNAKKIWIVGNNGLYLFDPIKNRIELKYKFYLNWKYRTNDAGVDAEGNLWIGVMEKEPSGLNGHIFILKSNGEIRKIIDNIGIPNTFCWSDELNAMLVSDSYQKRIYAVNIKADISSIDEYPVALDLSETDGAPDGGALDERGNLWNANWGLKRLIYHDLKKIKAEISVNAMQVSSVCFGGENLDQLLITTAEENLTEEDLIAYPESGCSFLLKNMKIKGRNPLGFSIKEESDVS